jgi:predicted secreted protein
MSMKLKIILLCLAVGVGLFSAAPRVLAADPISGSCTGEAASSPVCKQLTDPHNKTNNPVAGPDGLISHAANLLAVVGGVIAVIMVIVSGYMFVTAGGSPVGQRSSDPNRLKTARATLVGALIGAVVIALAWAITRFVTDNLIH